MPERLEIDALRALRAIDEYGGVTRAAEHLALSQSAVSHKIKRLETNLECALLNRRADAPLFTDTGERLLTYAKRILSLHEEALLALSKHTMSGKIRLGMTEDITSSGLSRILGRFIRLYPEVAVRTQVGQSLALESELEQGRIDIAIMQVFQTQTQPQDIIFYQDDLHWVKSFDFELDPSRPIPFLAFDANCFYQHWAQQHGYSHQGKCSFETVLECASTAGIVSAVQSGLGIALLNERHLTPQMQIIDDDFNAAPDIAYVIRTAHKSRNQAVTALVQEISQEVGNKGNLRAA